MVFKNIRGLVKNEPGLFAVMLITVFNEISVELLARHHGCVKRQLKSFRISIGIDFCIKAIGIILGIAVFPMSIMISVMLAMVFLIVWRTVIEKKK